MKSFLLYPAAALLCACGSRTTPAQLSFSVSTLRAAAPSRAALVVASGLDVQRVRLQVSRLKLEQAASGTAGAETETEDEKDDGHKEGEAELVQGPFQIDLDAAALTGKVEKVFDATVPAGTYREFKFEIAQVIVDGLIDGKPFSFTSALHAVQKREGTFVVNATSNNVTLAIDPSGWFGKSAAARLDPRDAGSRPAIEKNIRGSLRVFQDDDGSGHENHHGDGHHGERDGGASGGSGHDDNDGGSSSGGGHGDNDGGTSGGGGHGDNDGGAADAGGAGDHDGGLNDQDGGHGGDTDAGLTDGGPHR